MPKEAFEGWSIRLLLSEEDGITPMAAAFPYSDKAKLSGYKVITMKKKSFWSVGNTKDADMFGFERAMSIGGKTLYITEGEWDAVALNWAMVEANKNSKFAKKGYPVMSLPSGADSVSKAWIKCRKRILTRFEKIVFVMDDDEAGIKAEKTAQMLIPEEMYRCDKPAGCKDPNDALAKKKGAEMASLAMWKSHKPPTVGVVRVRNVLARAIEKPEYGLSYPFDEFTELTYGQRDSEAVCLAAGVGLGKTVTAHKFGAWNMTEHDRAIFAVLLEEQNHNSVRNFCSHIDGIAYNNPNTVFDQDQFISTAESLEDKLFMWESDGDQHLRFDMEEILAAIRFNNLEYGCKTAYIDNFTRLVDHLSPSAANEFINKYASEIENLAVQLDMHIMCFSHLNAPKMGPSHEEGAPVYASQMTGSKGIMRSFPMLMSFRRNKHSDGEDGRDKNNSILSVIKNRKYGNEGDIRTKYLPETGELIACDWEGELMNPQPKR